MSAKYLPMLVETWQNCNDQLRSYDPNMTCYQVTGNWIVLERSRFTIVDNIHYYVDSTRENNLRIAVPTSAKQKLMLMQVVFYNTLSKRYWLEHMYREVNAHCSLCITIATYGHRQKVPQKSISVSERFGVDIMQMPQTEPGHYCIRGLLGSRLMPYW